MKIKQAKQLQPGDLVQRTEMLNGEPHKTAAIVTAVSVGVGVAVSARNAFSGAKANWIQMRHDYEYAVLDHLDEVA